VDCAIELEENLEITCDSEQIKQVIINLFNNSIDVIEHLRSRWIKIEGVKKDNKVILSFVDSGEGIPKKIRDQIFDPFFTTKDPQKGTGLGLGIVRDILSQHGATCEISHFCPDKIHIKMTFFPYLCTSSFAMILASID
jgi:signal transduction histidine kinase